MNTRREPTPAYVVDGLRDLVADLGTLPGWPHVQLDACLLIWDVLSILRVRPRSSYAILGPTAIAYIKERLGHRYLPTDGGCDES